MPSGKGFREARANGALDKRSSAVLAGRKTDIVRAPHSHDDPLQMKAPVENMSLANSLVAPPVPARTLRLSVLTDRDYRFTLLAPAAPPSARALACGSFVPRDTRKPWFWRRVLSRWGAVAT